MRWYLHIHNRFYSCFNSWIKTNNRPLSVNTKEDFKECLYKSTNGERYKDCCSIKYILKQTICRSLPFNTAYLKYQ